MKPIYTEIPGRPAIELVDYYEEFLHYYPRCEMQTKAWFVEHVRPEWSILDCGANIGYFTILFCTLANRGHVWAFEPTTTMEKLRRNVTHHALENLTCVDTALGDKKGRFIDDVHQVWGSPPLHQAFEFTTIDDYLQENALPAPDLLKIDVDSWDFAVLQGARQTLLQHDPWVMVELNHALALRNHSVPMALDWMRQLGYREARVFDYENFLFKRSAQSSIPARSGFTIHFPERP